MPKSSAPRKSVSKGSPRRDAPVDLFAQALEHHKAGRIDEAEALYIKLLIQVPDHNATWRNLGVIQRKRGNREAAIAFAKRSIELSGVMPEVLGNLENALIDAGRADEAYSLNIQLPPNPPPNQPFALTGREARLRRAMGHAREACGLLDRAPDPNGAEANLQLDHAMALMEAGQYRKGFELFECRWQSGQITLPQIPKPRWNLTDDLTGKHLLLFSEQGLGDWIFLSRFLPRLRETGLARLSVVVRKPLLRLMEACPLVDEVYDRDAKPQIGKVDCWMTAFDLCRLYLDEDQPITPPMTPELPADSLERGKKLTTPFADRLKVGICWATSPTGRKAAHKSVDVFRFLPLTEVPGTQFFSLYKGKDDDVLTRQGLHPLILDTGRSERDLADSAGLMRHLDLVITVDTAVAHLSASLGVPTWILVPEPCFWYWRPFGEACQFYPAARLIRQSVPGDWTSPFARIKMDLERMQR